MASDRMKQMLYQAEIDVQFSNIYEVLFWSKTVKRTTPTGFEPGIF